MLKEKWWKQKKGGGQCKVDTFGVIPKDSAFMMRDLRSKLWKKALTLDCRLLSFF